MHKTLESLADIRTGYTFRGKIAPDPLGNVRVLQIKDIKDRPTPNEQLPLIKVDDLYAAQPLSVDDIVFPARGEYYRAAMISKTRPDEDAVPIVASSQLWVLSVRSDVVTPQFVCWYLNLPSTWRKLSGMLSGSNIPMLSKQELGSLQIPVPDLGTQEKIVTLHYLWEREKQVTQQLLDNRETMLAGIFQNLLES